MITYTTHFCIKLCSLNTPTLRLGFFRVARLQMADANFKKNVWDICNMEISLCTFSQFRIIRLSQDARADLLWRSSSGIGSLPASFSLLAGRACQTYKCLPMLPERPVLVRILTAFIAHWPLASRETVFKELPPLVLEWHSL